MILTAADFVPVWPEILLLVMVCVILIADLFLRDDQRAGTYLLSLLTLGACAVVTVLTSTGDVTVAMHGMFVDDPMSDTLKVMVYIAVATMLIYSRSYVTARGMFRGEFFTLVLFATLGMMVMISANHFLTLYLGLELLSLSMYALVALQRDSNDATEAAMKYFVLGALASGMLLYGMSMIYGATGSLEITRVAERIASG